MNLRWMFYVQNLDMVILEMLGAFSVWTVLMLLLRGRAKRIVSAAAAVLSAIAVLVMTLYHRDSSGISQISLIPFISFVNAREQAEFYRTMLMNVCLFLPLGLSLPFALSYRTKHCVLSAVFLAFVLSFSVETIQLIFRIGLCETDDVIMNTLGALIGAFSYLICRKAEKFNATHRHRHIGR